MAKLKKASGFLIGQWKKEALAANPRASDTDLAKIINDSARKLGYNYTITPEKVRSKTTQPATQAAASPKPAPAAPSGAKERKKAPPRLIGNWKQEAITANPGASDEHLAKIINAKAAAEGYDYTISPEKVRTTAKPAPQAETPVLAPTPAQAQTQAAGSLTDNLQTFVQLVGKEEAKEFVENMIERL
jgi:hypothetical protein